MSDMDDEKFEILKKIPPDAISSGLSELQHEIFRIGRWFDATTKTIDALNDWMHAHETSHPLYEMIKSAGSDLLEAGIILAEVRDRDGMMAAAGEQVKTTLEATQMTSEIEEFLADLKRKSEED